MRPWWYKSLSGQLVAALIFALVLAQVISFLFIWQDRRQGQADGDREEFIARAISLARILPSLPPDRQSDIARKSATRNSRYWLALSNGINVGQWRHEMVALFSMPLDQVLDVPMRNSDSSHNISDTALEAMRQAIVSIDKPTSVERLGDVPRGSTELTLDDDGGKGFIIPLANGSSLNAAYFNPVSRSIFSTPIPIIFAFTATIVAVSALLIVRRITKPLARLAAAAEAIGRGEETEKLSESGPDDIRHTAEAFNRMQERLRRFVNDRTDMLAAISHDLRTPLTTLRLRAEFVEDEDLQERIFATIDEMRAMMEATLALIRQENVTEPTRTVDLAAFVGSICDDLAEIGSNVRFADSERVTYRCRPDSLRRAVRNLIENAVRYGTSAEVLLTCDRDNVKIRVIDEGPGIPEHLIDEVFAPFFRLETSRNSETGGAGLGLSISRAIVRGHGGDVVLRNLKPGLEALICLPRSIDT